MSQQCWQNARTASPENSIWRYTPEATFRNHLVTLEERTNAVPVPPRVFPLPDDESDLSKTPRLLPLQVEQSLADDLAYIVAVGEGAQSVSAVCVEENYAPHGLCLRVAAEDTIQEQLRNSLQEIGHILSRAATAEDESEVAADVKLLNQVIVKLHFQKLLGRLRSCKWKKPEYLAALSKKPLWQDFDNLIHRVEMIYPKKKNPIRPRIQQQFQELAKVYRGFEDVEAGSSAEHTYLLGLVESSYRFCMLPDIRLYAARLETAPKLTPQIAGALKSLRQIEKIGAYRRIAIGLISLARKYPALFGGVRFEYLFPYSYLDTDIGYEKWARSLHVHAEVQLIVHYDLAHRDGELSTRSTPCLYHPPRAIGTSKYLCYLCYLFIKHHGVFFPCNTHGRLYDQWTLPDLNEYDDQLVERYRKIIEVIDGHVVEVIDEVGPKAGKRDSWRVEPMTSRQNLLLMPIDIVQEEESDGKPIQVASVNTSTQNLHSLTPENTTLPEPERGQLDVN